jgi:hypothetical protein
MKKVLRKVAGRSGRLMRFFVWAASSWRLFRFLAWVLPTSREGERRLLVVYDLAYQPYSIGDIIHVQEAALALREIHDAGMIDFAMVYDHHDPSPIDEAYAGINRDNVHHYLSSLLPVLQVNAYLGSVMIFNSHEQLEKYVSDNKNRYVVWPSAGKYASGLYLNYLIFNEVLYGYYQIHGSIPSLTCRPFLRDAAFSFFYRHVWPDIPVTVQMRNNPSYGTHRNAHIESWIEFFNGCRGRYPVKFVVICSLSEVDNRLRECSNVIIAKDQHTNIELELAMIHEAAMHMGSSSGMATMAEFNDKPYFIVNTDINLERYKGMIREDNFVRFFFASPFQRFSFGQETPELLAEQFERMMSTVDTGKWWSPETIAKHKEQNTLT